MRGAISKYFMDTQNEKSVSGRAGRRYAKLVTSGRTFDRDEILQRIFKALREAAFWSEMHERVSRMMVERGAKRLCKGDADRRGHCAYKTFKGIDKKSGKRI